MTHQGLLMTPDQIAQLPYRPCVGVMLANPRGHVFVGQRKDNAEPAWQMPQGGVDQGETCRVAAVRELWEETGVTENMVTLEAETQKLIRYDLPHDVVPRVWKGRYRGQEQKWFLFRFHGTDADINIKTAHPEFSAWKWLPPEDVVDSIVPFKREVYREVMAAFAGKL